MQLSVHSGRYKVKIGPPHISSQCCSHRGTVLVHHHHSVPLTITKMPEKLKFDKCTGVYTIKDQNLLTKIMQDEFQDNDIKIQDVITSMACKSGDNYMSQVQRLRIIATNKNDNVVQKNLIMKVQNQTEEKARILSSDRIWQNEDYVYKTLLPKFEKICESSFCFPKYYYGDNNIILMEDLTYSGYYLGDRQQGVDYEHTLTVMDKLAKFHAASLSLKHNNPEEYSNLISNYNHPFSNSVEESLPYVKKSITSAMDMLKSSITDHEKYERFFDQVHQLLEGQGVMKFENYEESNEVVITHGDLWGNNTMFVEKDTKLGVAFLDFQATRPGSAIKDLFYFLYLSVQSSVRMQKFDFIMRYYHEKRNGYLKKFIKDGSIVDEEFSFAKFERELLKFRYFGFVNAALTLPMIVYDAENDEKYDFFSSENNCNQEKFRTRLLEIVDEYVDRGWDRLDLYF